jgi:hypothetical protein
LTARCCIAWKLEWRAHHAANYDGLQDDAQRRVLVDRCLGSADKERVRYKSSMDQVWEYLDRAYLRQDVFLHDLKGQCPEIFTYSFFHQNTSPGPMIHALKLFQI